ncbi:hypothetical protein DERF_014284 [Dermatophagoides farinae]|uniref:Uncharacterized protein n=1 Tax=Dermatophagoides farinae TaxID=6954 RepID=A0A922KSQ8_DERFA|nr:hypothetical protein DERF_014284 [Dermatophagoides farinae]
MSRSNDKDYLLYLCHYYRIEHWQVNHEFIVRFWMMDQPVGTIIIKVSSEQHNTCRAVKKVTFSVQRSVFSVRWFYCRRIFYS